MVCLGNMCMDTVYRGDDDDDDDDDNNDNNNNNTVCDDKDVNTSTHGMSLIDLLYHELLYK